MEYLEISVDLTGKQAFSNDVVTAFLAEMGCESFTEEGRVISGFIQVELYSDEKFDLAKTQIISALGECVFNKKELENKNWNAEWESQFKPVEVNGTCVVRAPFHSGYEDYKYDIVIMPKMSFGTGHHETTFLMLQQMLEENFEGKDVVDCGCGTGVLGIMAAMKGAKSVFAFDYDEWCFENCTESIALNSITQMEVGLGDLSLLEGKTFDIVLANINRNILTNNMAALAQSVRPEGRILMSGFYEKDISIVEKVALDYGLKFVYFNTKNNWTIVVFSK